MKGESNSHKQIFVGKTLFAMFIDKAINYEGFL